jgi:hypothetical protein
VDLVIAVALRGSRTATKAVSVLFTIGTILLFVGALLNAVESLLTSNIIAAVAVGAVSLGLAAYLVFSAYLEWQWLRHIDPEQAA